MKRDNALQRLSVPNHADREIPEFVEHGEWEPLPKKKSTRYAEMARVTLRKDKRVNIRITERDLVRFPKRAIEEGLPYQTLISRILHKYINGRLQGRN
ncbi:antitoxin [bacterium]|nr:antitoxin [bacterium]